MTRSSKLFLLLFVVVIASGCVSNITGSSESEICDADFDTTYQINSENFNLRDDDIYGAGEVTVSGDIIFRGGLPSGVTKDEVLEKMDIGVKVADEGSVISNARYGAETVCNATINAEKESYSCSFNPEPVDSYLFVSRGLEGCEKGGSSGTNIEFVKEIEDQKFENKNFSMRITESSRDRNDGWKNIWYDLYLENKNIGSKQAPQGISFITTAYSPEGKRLGRVGEISDDVLKGYSSTDSGAAKIRQDQQLGYILAEFRGFERNSLVFKITE